MKIKKIILIPIVLLLAGCATQQPPTVHLTYMTTDSAPLNASDTNAQAQVAEAATAVSQSMQQISAIQAATHPHAKLGAPMNPASIGMAQQTSVNWNGPVEPILKRIANASHYSLRVLGAKPAIPVIVSLNANNQTLAEILRNVTFQVQKKAAVAVYPASHVIELRYYS